MTRTLSYVHGASSVPLLGETIGANLRRTVTCSGDTEALVVRHQTYRATYCEFWDQTTRAARALIANGIAHGDRVGMWAPNRYEWVVIQYAAARIGAILVNINPAYRAPELEFALSQSGAELLLMARGFRGSNYPDVLEQARMGCPRLRHCVVLDDEWQAFLQSGDRTDPHDLEAMEATVQFDDPVTIQYTSGTTGAPKGATLSQHAILNNGYSIGERLHFSERDRVCIPVPFYHAFGMILGNLACTSHGSAMVVPCEGFEPRAVLETVEAERCTALYGVPTMFIAELECAATGEFDCSSLRTGIMAGSPCPIEVMRQVQTRLHMPEVTIGYGLTETVLSTLSDTDDPLERRVSTVGRVNSHFEIKIVEPSTGEVVPTGTPGELCARGYGIMRSYWNNPAGTRQAIDDSRWMHTGDLATIDDEGYVNIVGRIKDMIIRGGENIYPREIEEVLHAHPSVSDVQVVGVPSERYGEEVMAWIKLRPTAVASETDLSAFCDARLAHFKLPRYWKFVDGFPMTVTGKVQKSRMRELAIEELGLAHAAGVATA
jgi:fatty-acyl-CoA synthase